MQKRFYPYGLALLSGCLLLLSFPPYDLYLFAWLAFVPLFFAIQGQGPAQAFLSGWICGLTYFIGTLSWVTISMSRYGNLPWIVSSLVMLLLVSYLAVYVGLFSVLIQYLALTEEKWLLLFTPSLWVILEFIKGHLLSGFPWASLAYSQTKFLPMIQIADFGSIYSVGFVMIFFNRAVYLSLSQNTRKIIHWRPLLIGLSVFLLSFFYGMFQLSAPIDSQETLTVSVIQGNIAQDEKWDRSFQDQTIETYHRLSLSTLKEGASLKPSLIIWPEAALPFIFDENKDKALVWGDLIHHKSLSLLFGAPSIKSRPSGKIELLNSAYLMSSNRESLGQYNKMHLVPFGEYVPLSGLLFFVSKLVEGVGDFVPGGAATVFETGHAKVGTVICFEVVFPELVRRFVNNGATLMTTITNDAWFGRSAAPFQHFSMVTFRAVENRISFARAANTGISGFIDPYGRIIRQTKLFVEATATESLPLRHMQTLYTRFGDFIAILCGIITLIILSVTTIKRRIKHAL